MNISEKKNIERNIFKTLRNESSFNDRKNVAKNVKIYLNSFLNKREYINNIAIYWPLKNEVDIRSLKDNFSLALPRCKKNKRISFYHWDEEPLSEDYEGILAPRNSNLLSFKEITIIFLPCLAVDKNFIRLGYGGGYFDKLREDKKWSNIPCIGLLTSNCVSKISLTRADWDIPLSGFITEKEILI